MSLDDLIDGFLHLFAFGTGVPLGYLLFYGGLAVASMVALGVLVVSAIRKRRGVVVVSAAFLICAVLWFAGNVVYESAIQEAAPVERGALVGTWRQWRSTLVLRSDGTYELTGSRTSHGRWQFMPMLVQLEDANRLRLPPLYLFSFRHRLHLTFDPSGDDDTWDADLGFRKE